MSAVSALSNQNIWVPVRSDHPIGGPTNLTSYPVEVAVTVGDPVTADWHPAAWEAGTKTIGGDTYYLARLEIGPVGGVLTLINDQTYQVHARVTTAGEKPVVYAGAIQAY